MDVPGIIAIVREYNSKRGAGRMRAPLTSAAKRDGTLSWGSVCLPSGLVVAHRDGTLVFETSQRRSFLADGAPNVDSVWFRGDYLLVLEANGTNPRLYDARTAHLVWSSRTATGTSLWPKLAAPP